MNRYGLLMGAILGMAAFAIAGAAITECTGWTLEQSIQRSPAR